MAYPNSGSIIDNKINCGLSTQIVVKVGPTTIGAIQSLTVNQNRDINVWEEIGTDGMVDSHPRGAAKIDINVSRLVFNDLRLTEAFGRGFVNIQSQRFPFNINIIDKSNSSNDANYVVHTLHNCWFRRYSTPYSANDFIIIEQADITLERISSMQNGLNVAEGGKRGIKFDFDTMERSTDIKGVPGKITPKPLLQR